MTITTVPLLGTLADNGLAVTVGQVITLADITAGLLKFTPAANANGSNYAIFAFQVHDDGGTARGFFFNDTATTEIYTLFPTRRSSDLGTDKTVTTLEDTAYAFTAADFGFSDTSD